MFGVVAVIVSFLVVGCAAGRQAAPAAQQTATAEGSSSSDFDDKVQLVRTLMPVLEGKSSAIVNIVNDTTGKELVLSYMGGSAAYNDKLGMWVLHLTAKSDDEPFAHLVLSIKALEPGTYAGSASETGSLIMAHQVAKEFDGTSSDCSWSLHEGSWCQLDLAKAEKAGDLEGTFKAKLVDGNEKAYVRISEAYLYLNM